MSRAADLFQRILDGGTGRIQEMIDNRETEELFLDYKRSADCGRGRSLDNSDKSNLSKAISGFGNSEGGLIIWGVDCRSEKNSGDVPTGSVPIENPIRYKSLLEQITTGMTIPPHDGVRHEAFMLPGCNSGFVVTYVPKGNHVPYQTTSDLRYIMRSGSNFAPVPHGVLAGMFGRQPQPNVFAMFVATDNYQLLASDFVHKFGIGLHNSGPGIAEDVYVNLRIMTIGGPNCSMMIEQDHIPMWSNSNFATTMWSSIMMRDYRLAPDATVTPMIVTIKMRPPFVSPFRIKISSGANRAAPHKGEWNVQPAELTNCFDKITNSSPDDFRAACRAFGDRLLQI
ncbi:AlbA family DNA-binding domain-containing protein [Methylobacterium tarhaniae]|uniref:AlbA family DNA-binding domain-containing protein n=1 Tax=Methylobacterium tarhaniae TaxID=1187852 RepID=UPI003D029164